MAKKYEYNLTYDGYKSIFDFPELNGKPIIRTPDNILTYGFLCLENFSYEFEFKPYNSKEFTSFEVSKLGGSGETARGDQWPCKLTREEADGIAENIIYATLKIDAEVSTNSENFIEHNPDYDEDDEELTDEEIESDIKEFFMESDDEDFEWLDDYLMDHECEYSGDIYEFAFREAVRQGKAGYIDEHSYEIELNDGDGCSTYLDETDDEDIKQLLIDNGACRSWEDFYDCQFAVETVEWTFLAFDTDFQEEVYEKYKEENNLTDEQVIAALREGDSDIAEIMYCLGIEEENGEITFANVYNRSGMGALNILRDLGYSPEFEGNSWTLETIGVYYIE